MKQQPRRSKFKLVIAGFVVLAAWVATVSASGDLPVDFVKSVAPILEARCIRCHQPGNKKGEVSVATVEDLGAGEFVVPGKPDESGIFKLIESKVPGKKPRMPKTGEPLTEAEVSTIRQWIVQGAKWPAGVTISEKAKAGRDWWSLRPLAQATPPDPPGLPDAWKSNPIDRFIFAKLKEKGLSPSPLAEPRDLIRRVTYDLTGLPPLSRPHAAALNSQVSRQHAAALDRKSAPIAQINAPGGSMLPAKNAHDGLVDELLASQHYGEHWGRHWLDVVRFGESNGYERNVLIDNLWPFRDYVIRSLNDDKPFDRFIREHLAGDALDPGNPTVEAGVAFLLAGPYDDVGNQDAAQAAQIRADDMDEMIRTTSEAFLGMTVGCARCHDHKFDPIKQTDYYRLYATFAGVGRGNRVVATTAAQKERTEREAKLIEVRTRLQRQIADLDDSILSRAERMKSSTKHNWTRPATNRYGTEDKFEPIEARQVRLTVESRDDNPNVATGFHLDEFEIWTAEPRPRNVALAKAGAKAVGSSRVAEDFRGAYGPGVAIDGKFDQRLLSTGSQLTIVLPTKVRVDRIVFSADRQKALRADHGETTFIGEYRIDVSTDGIDWKQVASSAVRAPSSPAHRRKRLIDFARTTDDRSKAKSLHAELAKVNDEIARLPTLPNWWVGQFKPDHGPFTTFVGGNPQKKGAVVSPGSPEFLEVCKPSTLKSTTTSVERRAALAEWIVSTDNPLAARVLANRIWHYHFGVGLVDTPADFGYMGSKPTHPELLDWLANQIRVHGLRLKPIHRLILTSQTYQQSAAYRADQAAIDGDARYLWRFPPRRLTGEEIRDSMLTVAGKLNPAMGGPGFRLYRYLQDNVSTYVPLDRVGPETYRRAVYHQNARAARVDFLTDFDAPDCAFAASKRANTTTPLQALTLLNHPFTGDMAGFLAERIGREVATGSIENQIRRAFDLVYSRAPTTLEVAAASQFVRKNGLLPFCRALFNSNEFLYVN